MTDDERDELRVLAGAGPDLRRVAGILWLDDDVCGTGETLEIAGVSDGDIMRTDANSSDVS